MNSIKNKISKIKELCELHNVDKLYVFGSVAKNQDKPESDIDFLVKFRPFDITQYFDNYMNFKEKLVKLFQKNVDLVEEQTLKNPILIDSINNHKELIYG
ncbi:nucleotidyltransferase family protein [Flammeovirga pacifica]|uniref:Nucleotidyltransferase n=1 Tax=Flammeovirga pacifica TaxID=915059 RepID=A0A1S1YX23_FLAPC|nr:nucleotidyltransferase domain-containing protein [Flammeovirga pacifica]OHX65579.1 nucleotidyltransferase [Flammeovirga pacifica]